MHALIIEDSVLIAWAIESSLREMGFGTFDIAVTESDAVIAAAKRCPDLIVADCRFSEGSGWQAVLTICTDRLIPIVFIAEDSYLSSRPWWSVVIQKPYSESALFKAIRDTTHRARVIKGVMGGEPTADLFQQTIIPPSSGSQID